MAAHQQLPTDDWDELKLAPLWILAAVAGADGKVEDTEHASHVEAISRFTGNDDELVSRVFTALAQDFTSIWAKYLGDPRSAMQGITTVAQVLARIPDPSTTLPLRQALLELGATVADAEGGLLNLGRKRSRPEREALATAAQILGVQV